MRFSFLCALATASVVIAARSGKPPAFSELESNMPSQSFLPDFPIQTSPLLLDAQRFRRFHRTTAGTRREPKVYTVIFDAPSKAELEKNAKKANDDPKKPEKFSSAEYNNYKKQLKKAGAEFKIIHRLENVINGVIVRIEDFAQAQRSSEYSGVKAVSESPFIDLPTTDGDIANDRPRGKVMKTKAGKFEIENIVDKGESNALKPVEKKAPSFADKGKADKKADFVPSAEPVLNLGDAHQMTGVDDVHQEGVTGKGVVVAVVDTGVNPHPAFGDCSGGPGTGNCRLLPGVSVIDGGVLQDLAPDADGHGTHVAGIVAGNDGGDFVGVAPDAQILPVRVFAPGQSARFSDIAIALDVIARSPAMIVNMSLGSSTGFMTFNALEEMIFGLSVFGGRTVVAAAGNDGEAGLFLTSTPGTALTTLSVASVDNDKVSAHGVTTSGGDEYLVQYAVEYTGGDEISGVEVVASTDDVSVPADGCNPYPPGTFAGKVALIHRGNCAFATKVANAVDAGAVAVLLDNNESGAVVPSLGTPTTTLVAMITQADGRSLRDDIKSGTVTLTFSAEQKAFPHPNRGKISPFSSWGLEASLAPRPSIAAPGGSIVSARASDDPTANEYVQLSGTSMSSPYVAGIIALIHERFDFPVPFLVSDALMSNSARPLKENGRAISTAVQGAGLVDAGSAVFSPTAALSVLHGEAGELVSLGSFGSFELDWAHKKTSGRESRSFRRRYVISNESPCSITYRLSHENASFATQHDKDGNLKFGEAPEHDTNVGKSLVTFEAGGSITVGPNSIEDLLVSMRAPTKPRDQIGIYSGFIKASPTSIDCSAGPTKRARRNLNQFPGTDNVLRIPYSGFVGDYSEMNVLDERSGVDPILILDNGFVLERSVQDPNDVPVVDANSLAILLFRVQHPAIFMQAYVRPVTEDGVPLAGLIPDLAPAEIFVFQDLFIPRNLAGFNGVFIDPSFVATPATSFYQVVLEAQSMDNFSFTPVKIWTSGVFQIGDIAP